MVSFYGRVIDSLGTGEGFFVYEGHLLLIRDGVQNWAFSDQVTGFWISRGSPVSLQRSAAMFVSNRIFEALCHLFWNTDDRQVIYGFPFFSCIVSLGILRCVNIII